MLRALPSLVVASCLAAVVIAPIFAAEEAAPWPQANGPHSNYNPLRYGHKLVDDLKNARQVWMSEDTDLGFAKGSVSGYTRHLAAEGTHPGSTSGLIVAEGLVFASTFRPSGDVWAENNDRIAAAARDDKWTAEQRANIRHHAAIAADDLTIAYDTKTGRVAWKAEENGKGVNRYSGKRNHFGVTPAYHDGRVFSYGTTGRLYCYDAKTGEKLWEDDSDPFIKLAEQERAELLKERDGLAGGNAMSASLVVADGVVVVPQYAATRGRDIGVRGVDAKNGKTLWQVPAATCRYATPAVWTHGDKQYVLAATIGEHNKHDSAEMKLIDPRTGDVLWTVKGLAPTWYGLAPSKEHVLVNTASKHNSPKRGEPWALMTAYKLSPTGAKRVWTMPDKPPFQFENHFDSCCRRRLAVRDGRIYFYNNGATVDPQRKSRFFSILDEKTGDVIYTSDNNEFKVEQLYLIEDRILNNLDASHSDRATFAWMSIDPQNVRMLCEPWAPPQKTSTAYEVFMELPYADGYFFMRTQTGQVACYDLRAERVD